MVIADDHTPNQPREGVNDMAKLPKVITKKTVPKVVVAIAGAGLVVVAAVAAVIADDVRNANKNGETSE